MIKLYFTRVPSGGLPDRGELPRAVRDESNEALLRRFRGVLGQELDVLQLLGGGQLPQVGLLPLRVLELLARCLRQLHVGPRVLRRLV